MPINTPKLILWDWLGTLYINDHPAQYAHELITLFKTKNIKQAIVSNGYQEHIIIPSQWTFDLIVSRSTGLPLKPHPTMLIYAMNTLQISPSDTLFIGDSISDIHAAQAAHCHSYHVTETLLELYQLYIHSS